MGFCSLGRAGGGLPLAAAPAARREGKGVGKALLHASVSPRRGDAVPA